MWNQVFETARQIPAYAIAQRAGLSLRQRGGRYWMCCPFHGEKTASLCFFPDGGWKCFGCGKSGDAVSFAHELYGLPLVDAAKKITAAYELGERPQAFNIYSWKGQRIKQHYGNISAANYFLQHWTMEAADQAWDDPLFASALRVREEAERALDSLYQATEDELHALRRENTA